jgi:hypothetical protein
MAMAFPPKRHRVIQASVVGVIVRCRPSKFVKWHFFTNVIRHTLQNQTSLDVFAQ